MSIAIQNRTRRTLPRIQFEKIKNRVLSPKYEISLVFVGPAHSRRLNRIYRGKDYPTDVLSFPLSKTAGEIFIDLSILTKEMKKFDMSYAKLAAFLFIHACLHLKGMKHGDRMSQAEKRILNEFFPR